ncbi:MAG TPA: carboxylate-amine ligase [Pyrinomonadaceae bacterium]|jgi:carboxylate-amine ligase|nr:carboxylate-amine ligase [Pyrinomonadaceae bacterium]
MSIHTEDFTLGVEEEYQIIHPETRELRSRAARILLKAEEAVGQQVQSELYLSQIEIGTRVCSTLVDVRAELVRLRREVIAAAARDGSSISAAGTHPFSHWEGQLLTPKDRYRSIAEDYQQLAREQLIFGCHVHVGISDREAAIQVMNRARGWLAPLLALSANSPFWLGADTGYASFRTEIWRRWPMAGTPQVFGSRSEYDALVETLVATGSISDATKIYWDVRPSARFETLEFRVTDVCLTVDEAVMMAGLVRALARTCFAQAARYEPTRHPRPEVLRAAKWRAARYGLTAELIDVEEGCAVPARRMIGKMLTFLRPSLEELGEWEEVSDLVSETLGRGTGSQRQREAYARAGRLEDVVDLIVSETAKGVDQPWRRSAAPS